MKKYKYEHKDNVFIVTSDDFIAPDGWVEVKISAKEKKLALNDDGYVRVNK